MITEIKPHETIELEFDDETLALLKVKADSLNMSFDALCNRLLLDNISNTIEAKDAFSEPDKILNNLPFIVCDDGKPICRITYL